MLTDTVQFANGKQVEAYLDQFFWAQGFVIKPTTSYEERRLCLGDRRFTAPDGKPFYVEYKSGIQTYYTGNIFLETISVDTQRKLGWVYTCQADFIYYTALLNRKILVFRPNKLRAEINTLKSKFKETKTGNRQNKGYNTHGVLVPLEYAEKYLAERVITI
jgi:hypothetical protein